MEFKWIFLAVLYAAGCIVAAGWYEKKTPRNDWNGVEFVAMMVGYPLVLLYKLGQFLAVAK
jgi:hypothetical protein